MHLHSRYFDDACALVRLGRDLVEEGLAVSSVQMTSWQRKVRPVAGRLRSSLAA